MRIGIGIALNSLPKVASASPYVIRDTFTDVDGTPITSHVADTRVGAWFSANADLKFQIQSNKLIVPSADGSNGFFDMIYTESNKADCTLELDVLYDGLANEASGIMFRSDGTLGTKWFFGFDSVANQTKLDVAVAGGNTGTWNDPFTFTVGQTYHLKVVLSGDQIDCYVNGTLVRTLTDTRNQALTMHGIVLYAPSFTPAIEFDNFTVL